MRVMTPGRLARLAIAKWPCGSLHRMDAQGGSFGLRKNEFVEDMFGSVERFTSLLEYLTKPQKFVG